MAKKHPAPPPPVATEVESRETLRALEALDGKLSRLLEPMIGEVQAFLDGLAGRSFGLAGNRAVALAVQLLLERLRLRVRCPRCKATAILRCRATRNAKGGSFQFEHSAKGKQTNHGGRTTFPQIHLMPAPPDRRRKRNK